MKHLIGLALFIAGIGIILLTFFVLVEYAETQLKIIIGLFVFAIATSVWGYMILSRLKD